MSKPRFTARQHLLYSTWLRHGKNATLAAEELGVHHSYVSRVVQIVHGKLLGKKRQGKDYQKPKRLGKRIMHIADCQVRPGIDQRWLSAIGHYVVDKKPDVIVCIGDFWDFEALCIYDKGKKQFEGRRLLADIQAGHEGMRKLLAPLRAYQEIDSTYQPRLVFTMGNHEHRFDRFVENNPEFHGLIGTETLGIAGYGWEVYDFLVPVEIEGIHFVHYLVNPFSGRPYGGGALNQLKHVGTSFCVGHKQTLDVAMKPTLDGRSQIGIIAGASYVHDEAYKGPQGNNHFRGIVMLNEARNGAALPMPVSTEYLLDRYADRIGPAEEDVIWQL